MSVCRGRVGGRLAASGIGGIGRVISIAALLSCSMASARAQTPFPPDAGPRVLPAPLIVFFTPERASVAAEGVRAVLEQVAWKRGTAFVDLSPPMPRPPEAARALRQAIEAYYDFKYKLAHEQLERALEEAGKTGAQGLATRELAEIYLYSALVATQRGDAAAAWQHFVRAATIEPTRRLDPVRFPPRVIESFQRARDSVTADPPCEVKVAVTTACQVYVDARSVRTGDAVRVPSGHHYVRVDCPGRHSYGAVVVISEAVTTLAPTPTALRSPAASEVVELARKRGAGSVIYAAISVSGAADPTLSIRLYQVDTGAERSRVLAKPGDRNGHDQIRRAVEHLIDEVVTPPPPIARPRRITTTPWYRRSWVWGVTGVVITTAVLLPFVVKAGPSSGFRVRPEGDFPP